MWHIIICDYALDGFFSKSSPLNFSGKFGLKILCTLHTQRYVLEGVIYSKLAILKANNAIIYIFYLLLIIVFPCILFIYF